MENSPASSDSEDFVFITTDDVHELDEDWCLVEKELEGYVINPNTSNIDIVNINKDECWFTHHASDFKEGENPEDVEEIAWMETPDEPHKNNNSNSNNINNSSDCDMSNEEEEEEEEESIEGGVLLLFNKETIQVTEAPNCPSWQLVGSEEAEEEEERLEGGVLQGDDVVFNGETIQAPNCPSWQLVGSEEAEEEEERLEGGVLQGDDVVFNGETIQVTEAPNCPSWQLVGSEETEEEEEEERLEGGVLQGDDVVFNGETIQVTEAPNYPSWQLVGSFEESAIPQCNDSEVPDYSSMLNYYDLPEDFSPEDELYEDKIDSVHYISDVYFTDGWKKRVKVDLFAARLRKKHAKWRKYRKGITY